MLFKNILFRRFLYPLGSLLVLTGVNVITKRVELSLDLIGSMLVFMLVVFFLYSLGRAIYFDGRDIYRARKKGASYPVQDNDPVGWTERLLYRKYSQTAFMTKKQRWIYYFLLLIGCGGIFYFAVLFYKGHCLWCMLPLIVSAICLMETEMITYLVLADGTKSIACHETDMVSVKDTLETLDLPDWTVTRQALGFTYCHKDSHDLVKLRLTDHDVYVNPLPAADSDGSECEALCRKVEDIIVNLK